MKKSLFLEKMIFANQCVCVCVGLRRGAACGAKKFEKKTTSWKRGDAACRKEKL